MHKKRQMYAKVGVLEEAIPMKKIIRMTYFSKTN